MPGLLREACALFGNAKQAGHQVVPQVFINRVRLVAADSFRS